MSKKRKALGWYMRTTDQQLATMQRAAIELDMSMRAMVEQGLAVAFPAYFVGGTTPQNTRAKQFDDQRETICAGGPSTISPTAESVPQGLRQDASRAERSEEHGFGDAPRGGVAVSLACQEGSAPS